MPFPATPGWVSLSAVVGAPHLSWLRAPGCGSPPLLAGVRWRRWCVVCGVWCVVCGVPQWCVGGVVAGVWCGWSLATPGGGFCALLPATPGWVSLPLLVGVPRHSWLRVPGAVPRHSWLGFAVGGGGCSSPLLAEGPWVRFPATLGWGPLAALVCGVWCVLCGVWCAAVVCWWGCGWCVFWLVPRHSWRRFLCATPHHSWPGSAAGGGGCSTPLLAEGPGCGSPRLLAGFRCRRWWVLLATSG